MRHAASTIRRRIRTPDGVIGEGCRYCPGSGNRPTSVNSMDSTCCSMTGRSLKLTQRMTASSTRPHNPLSECDRSILRTSRKTSRRAHIASIPVNMFSPPTFRAGRCTRAQRRSPALLRAPHAPNARGGVVAPGALRHKSDRPSRTSTGVWLGVVRFAVLPPRRVRGMDAPAVWR